MAALKITDIKLVKIEAPSSYVLHLRLDREPDKLEEDLIETWPYPTGGRHQLAVRDGLLWVVLADPDQALTSVKWLMGENGLAAISARAEEMRAVGQDLLDKVDAEIRRLMTFE